MHSPFFKITATLLVGLLAALICVALKTPLPWMIGPLLSTAVWSMLNGPTQSWTPLRNVGQWVIGAALGLYFTPQTNALVLQLWWLVVLAIVLLVFGTKRLTSGAKDLGSAVKEFKKAAKEDDDEKPSAEAKKPAESGKSTGTN